MRRPPSRETPRKAGIATARHAVWTIKPTRGITHAASPPPPDIRGPTRPRIRSSHSRSTSSKAPLSSESTSKTASTLPSRSRTGTRSHFPNEHRRQCARETHARPSPPALLPSSKPCRRLPDPTGSAHIPASPDTARSPAHSRPPGRSRSRNSGASFRAAPPPRQPFGPARPAHHPAARKSAALPRGRACFSR